MKLKKMKKSGILAIFLFVALCGKSYAMFECSSTGPAAGCKTPFDAVHKCMKTSYANFLQAVRNDFKAGKDAVFPNFLMGNGLYFKDVSYNGVTYSINDPKCLQFVSGKPYADFADATDKTAYQAAKNAAQQKGFQAQQIAAQNQKMLTDQKEKAALVQACSNQCTTHAIAFNQCLSKKYPAVYNDLKTRFSAGLEVSILFNPDDFLSTVGNTPQAQNCLNLVNQVVKAMPYYAETVEGKQKYTIDFSPIDDTFKGLFSDDEIQKRIIARKPTLNAELAMLQAARSKKPVAVQTACTHSAVNTVGAYSECLATKHPEVYEGMKRAFVAGQKIKLNEKLGAIISQGMEKGLDPNYNPNLGDDAIIDVNKIELLIDGRTDLPPVLKDGFFKVYKSPALNGIFILSTAYTDAMASLDIQNFNHYIGIIDEDPAVMGSLTPEQIEALVQKFKGVFSDEEIILRKTAKGMQN